MKRDFKIVLTLMMLSLSAACLSQELPKDNLYFDFYQETWFCPHTNIRFIIERDTTIQFNLCGKELFLFDKGNKIDTLNAQEFKSLKIVQAKDIEKLRKQWFIKNDSLMKIKYPKGFIPPISNQTLFNPFVVVSPSEDSYIVFRVRFKFPWN